MCYFTKKELNKRFLPNRKNGWRPPVCTDERFRYVEVEWVYNTTTDNKQQTLNINGIYKCGKKPILEHKEMKWKRRD